MNPLLRSVIAGKIAVDNPITIMAYDGEDALLNKYPRKLFSTLTIFRNLKGEISYSSTLMKGFVPSRISKVDRGIFLETFLFFEAITVHYLSIRSSDDLWEYVRSQQEYIKTDSSLSKRLSWVAQECSDNENRIKINHLKELLTLRNQVTHNLEPKYLLYDNKVYKPDDSELISHIHDIMWDGMTALCHELLSAQGALESWIIKETINAPKQVIVMADGKRIVDGVKIE